MVISRTLPLILTAKINPDLNHNNPDPSINPNVILAVYRVGVFNVGYDTF